MRYAEVINGYKVVRSIRWYSKQDESLVGEIPLKPNLTELQKIFDEPSYDPIFFNYQITEQEVGYFRKKLAHSLDLAHYDYFLECHTV